MKLKPKPSIQQVDNFFPDNIPIEIAEWIRNANYRHGETDNTDCLLYTSDAADE